MKKIIYILILLLVSFTAIGQETPPSGLKAINAQFYIHLPDSTIWQQKGSPYNWHRVAKYSDLAGLSSIFKLKTDSILNDGYVTHGYFNANIPSYNFINGITKDGGNNVSFGGTLIDFTTLYLNGYSMAMQDPVGSSYVFSGNGFHLVTQDNPGVTYSAGYVYGGVGTLNVGAKSHTHEQVLNFDAFNFGARYDDDLKRGIKYGWTDDSNLGDSALVPKRFVTSMIAVNKPNSIKIAFTNQTSASILKYDSLYLANYGNNPEVSVWLLNQNGTYNRDEYSAPLITYLNQQNPSTGISSIIFKYPVATSGYISLNGVANVISVSPTNTKIQYLTLGNSITYGATVIPATQSYPAQMQATLSSDYYMTNLGVSGYSTDQINSIEVPQAIAAFDPIAYGKHIAILAGGTNDFRLGVSAATSYANFKKSCSQLIAAGYQVIVITPTALNDSTTVVNHDAAAAEAIRQQLITLLRNGYQTDLGASGIADWAANSIVGTYVGQGNQNLTYYNADGTHFTPTGYGLLASIVKPVLLQVVAGASGPDVKLANLTISSATFEPTFSPTINSYNAYVPSSTTSITVTPYINSAGQTVTVNGITATFSSPVVLTFVNGMSVTVAVTSSNGSLVGTYSVKVYKETAPYLDFSVSNSNIQASAGTGNWTSSTTGYGVTIGNMAGNGWIQFQRSGGTNDGIVYGFDTSPVLNNFLVAGVYQWSYGFYVNGGAISVVMGNSLTNTGISALVGYYRLNRTSGTVTLQYSAAGTSFSTIYTYGTPSTATMYAKTAITIASRILANATQSGFNH